MPTREACRRELISTLRKLATLASLEHYDEPSSAQRARWAQLVAKADAERRRRLNPTRRGRMNRNDHSQHLLTCKTCGCDRGRIARVVKTGGLPTLFEFEGKCGHRWTILIEPEQDAFITLPRELPRQLAESYYSLTGEGRHTAASLSIELFFGNVMCRVLERRVIPLSEATVHYICECCSGFLMNRFVADEARLHALDEEPMQW